MSAPIRASEFCIRTWPPETRLVALITGNFDDSQATGDVWTVAGFVGYQPQWDFFDELWQAALTKHEVPYFHMREMADPGGPFAKWLPAKDHADEVIEFFKDLVGAIRKSGLFLFSSTVWLRDLTRFNEETGLRLEPYPLAAYACMLQIATEYHRKPVSVFFDRIEKVESKLAMARRYGAADSHLLGTPLYDSVSLAPVPSPLTSRDVPALQAADFIAWELRKANFKMKEWQHSERAPASGREEQWRDYLEWTRKTTGTDPVLRKSLDAVVGGNRTKSLVWDEMQLRNAHESRRGVWHPPED